MRLLMFIFLIAMPLGKYHFVHAEDAAPQAAVPAAPAGAAAAPGADNEDYEIDYEEEADSESPEPEPTPEPKSKKGKKLAKQAKEKKERGAGIQGSRAKDRFTPFIRSETKSVYSKQGVRLDVDTD